MILDDETTVSVEEGAPVVGENGAEIFTAPEAPASEPAGEPVPETEE